MGWTFGSLIEAGMQMTAHCANCSHSQILDLSNLRDRLGPDAPAMANDLAPRMRCNACKAKKVGFSYTPDTAKNVGSQDGR